MAMDRRCPRSSSYPRCLRARLRLWAMDDGSVSHLRSPASAWCDSVVRTRMVNGRDSETRTRLPETQGVGTKWEHDPQRPRETRRATYLRKSLKNGLLPDGERPRETVPDDS
jgi:hypothetical protein